MEASSEERSGSGGGSKTSFLCRQSSTRWIPTSDQIRILRDLYYNTGLRSPSAEQIQRISARLRQYGKIEGKNVFYWFQNHKARERQKKRLTSDLPIHTSNTTTTTKNSAAAMSPGAIRIPLACSSPGLDGSRKMGSNGSCGGGSGLVKGSFGESFMSGRGGGGEVPAVESNMGWLGLDATTMPWMSMYHNYSLEQQYVHREMETLQLFPIHSQEEEEEQEQQKVPEETSGLLSHSASNNIDEQSNCMTAFYWPGGSQKLEQEDDHQYVYNHYPHNGSGGAASLDLTLNSYYAPPRST